MWDARTLYLYYGSDWSQRVGLAMTRALYFLRPRSASLSAADLAMVML